MPSFLEGGFDDEGTFVFMPLGGLEAMTELLRRRVISLSAVGIASDLTTGMLDRLRAMPVRGWTVLAGRSVADVIVSIGQVAIVAGVAAVALGFAPSGSIPEVLAGFGLIVFLGLAFSGVFMILGAAIRNPESAGAAASREALVQRQQLGGAHPARKAEQLRQVSERRAGRQ